MWRPTCAQIDLSAIRDNLRAIRARVSPQVRIMPAVKANGYGHGAVETSRACLDGGADALCVACIEEGVELRSAGIAAPILILGCSVPSAAGSIVEQNLASVLCDMSLAQALSEAALNANTTASVHIKIDTGMGRIGVPAAQSADFACEVSRLPGLRIDGVFTHFPSSDEADRSFTLGQIAEFQKVLTQWKRRGVEASMAHASNSGGILAYPEADFHAVRPGIMIYGLYPSSAISQSIPLREALTLKTKLVFVKEMEAGRTVSYGRTHVLKRRSKVGAIPIGYADGYLREFSNKGEVAVRGMRAPVIGRVCMDQCLVDITDVPGAEVGDDVTIYGGGYDFLNLTYVAERIGSIPNELLCAISKRVPRVYTE